MNKAPDPNYRPNGTYEDILSILARSEQRRYVRAGIAAPKKNAFVRWIADPILNLMGIGVMLFGEVAGASCMAGLHDKIMGGLAGKSRQSFDPKCPELESTRKLVAHIEEKMRTHPAVLCLMSHPPVLPESLGLNVEMVRQALLGLQSLQSGRGHHARLMIAVDAYALDMLEPIKGGLYAGFMGTYHLGLERLIRHRPATSRWLLFGTAWWKLPWRTSRYLARGGRLGMVLSGGVPITARVLYTSREFLWRLRRSAEHGKNPHKAAARLEKGDNDFAEFCRSDLIGPDLRRSAWRMMESWIVARLSGQWPPDRRGTTDDDLTAGRLPEDQLRCFRECAKALGHSDESSESLVRDFQLEYERETPYRERFFHFLLERVLSRGRPIVLLPLSHQLDSSGPAHAMKLAWGQPIALLRYEAGALKVCQGPAFTEETVPVDRFARDFVTTHYT